MLQEREEERGGKRERARARTRARERETTREYNEREYNVCPWRGPLVGDWS